MRQPLITLLSYMLSLNIFNCAEASCRYEGPNFDNNTVSISAKLYITINENCGHTFRTHGAIKIDNLVISSRPTHGVAGILNSIGDPGFAYHPSAGFVGQDTFQVTLDNYNGVADAKHKMKVDIDVIVSK